MPERLPPNIHFQATIKDGQPPTLNACDKSGKRCEEICNYLDDIKRRLKKTHEKNRKKLVGEEGPTITTAPITCSQRRGSIRLITVRPDTRVKGRSREGETIYIQASCPRKL